MRRCRSRHLALQHSANHNLDTKSLSNRYYPQSASDPTTFHQLYIYHIGSVCFYYIDGIFDTLAAFICHYRKWRVCCNKSQTVHIKALYRLFHKFDGKTRCFHLAQYLHRLVGLPALVGIQTNFDVRANCVKYCLQPFKIQRDLSSNLYFYN